MNATPAMTTRTSDVEMDVVNRVAVITLNRPTALNALSHAMVRDLAVLLERVRADDDIVALVLRGAGPKGFCAGGDVRAIHQLAQRGEMAGEDGWRQFFIDEYRLDYALHTFSKPVVALLDGVTMGGGMGLGQAARLRVATQRTKIAMPETRIGLLPDVGATRFLSVMPVERELYIGLTGAQLTGADAVLAGLADVCVSGEWLDGFEARLAQMPTDGDVLAALRTVFVAPCHEVETGKLEQFAAQITRYFDPRASVQQIAAALREALDGNPDEATRAWLQTTLDALDSWSPTMLEVTREALLRGRNMTLAECFRMELGIVTRTISEGDFCEGVRAFLVDKDQKPRWAPPTLAEVRAERVQYFLASPWRRDDHPLADLDA